MAITIGFSSAIKRWEGKHFLPITSAPLEKVMATVRETLQAIVKHHLSGKTPYIYRIEVMHYPPKPNWVIGVTREKYSRPLPPPLKGEIYDPIEMKTVLPESYTTPAYVYLPGAIIKTVDCARLLLTRGEKKFNHPIDNRELTSRQREDVVSQICEAFQIPSSTFYSLFDLTLSYQRVKEIEEDVGCQGANLQGRVTPKGMCALNYTFNNLPFDAEKLALAAQCRVSSILFDCQIELMKVSFLNLKTPSLLVTSHYLEYQASYLLKKEKPQDFIRIYYFNLENHINCSPMNNKMFFTFTINKNTAIPIMIKQFHCLTHLRFISILRRTNPEVSKKYTTIFQNQLATSIALQLLSSTTFFDQEKEEATKSLRLKKFEELTGVKLA